MARTRPACTTACYYSTGSARACECACGGANHGLAFEQPTDRPLVVAGCALYPTRICGDSRPVGEHQHPAPATSPPRPGKIITGAPETLDAMTDAQHTALDELIGIGEVTVTPAHDEDASYPTTAVMATHPLGQAVINADGTVVTLREVKVVHHEGAAGARTASAPVWRERPRPAGPWD